ncbi:acetolactate synthase large subunit [Blastococcus saxobsidens]|uniref:Putative acetolactate synthase large subunit (Acetohydroxyacid synthase) n=1 Tax=Blastococcus saxobsidens (strain DD2) TaxID=1146883 RepID=H6RUH5_BLASD|nr:acetolactate synthase large subunit [Blastococcus saxobsidens]CCG01940.1 putative acetolactate synthase large subunit (acetohydroxyacid synthase) [Blastococcus saxobsidens DD2]
MNGAQALIRTLVDAGVDVCFANPGTSEMHFVAALDDVPEMRGVLTLFEGVATGAADGYARMAGRPGATLLHLGPGMGNGLANLHNARRGRAPMVNVVGDHARAHKRLDAPLESDIDAVAGTFSAWVRRSLSPADVAADAVDAVAAVSAGGIATLILPADVSWEEGAAVAEPRPSRPAPRVAPPVVEEVAAVLAGGEPTVLFLGGNTVGEDGLLAAGQVAAGTGVRLMTETFPARAARGAGLPDVARLPYPPEVAMKALAGTRHLVLAGATAPVHFFGYPGVPGHPVPEDCTVHVLSEPGEDGVAALRALADLAAPGAEPQLLEASRPELPTGPLTPRAMSAVIGALLPERAIVVDEAITSGVGIMELTSGAPRHDWLALTGGAIGDGLPMALGAAVACPDRPVIGIQADGSAMYTISALWSYAREQADITTIICDNGSYAILQHELSRVGAAGDGERAAKLLDIGGPGLDFVSLAQGMGVPATRATTAEELADQLRTALAEPGPHLIDAVLR